LTNPVLSKPFDFRELEQLVVSLINRRKDNSGLRNDPVGSGLHLIN